MTGELFINSKDAWDTWGVNMGEGFLDALDAPLQMKDYIENESRLEHGKRVIINSPKVASRDITLSFTIIGTNETDYRAKKKAFEMELQKGEFTINVPVLGTEVYKMVYTGKSVSYGMNIARTFGHFTMKATEPNPSDRSTK